MVFINPGNVSIGNIAEEKNTIKKPIEITVIVFVSSVLKILPMIIPRNKNIEVMINNVGANNASELVILS